MGEDSNPPFCTHIHHSLCTCTSRRAFPPPARHPHGSAPLPLASAQAHPAARYTSKAMKEGAAVMRGPMASNTMHQLIAFTDWGYLDYLIIDMPPGTSDIHLTLGQEVTMDGRRCRDTCPPLAEFCGPPMLVHGISEAPATALAQSSVATSLKMWCSSNPGCSSLGSAHGSHPFSASAVGPSNFGNPRKKLRP